MWIFSVDNYIDSV